MEVTLSQPHERMFYELMWRIHGTGRHAPLPWWVQQNFRQWSDDYDQGLFPSKEAAFASNALYRYWNMVGVKDHHQESLVGQAGEVEPVYDKYALSFCLFDPAARTFHYPQFPAVIGGRSGLTQELEDGYLPIIVTFHVICISSSKFIQISRTPVIIDWKPDIKSKRSIGLR